MYFDDGTRRDTGLRMQIQNTRCLQMDEKRYNSFMALHTHQIIERFAKLHNISKSTALDLFYKSDFYKLYEQESTKLWHFSSVTLADLILQEATTGQIEFPVEG